MPYKYNKVTFIYLVFIGCFLSREKIVAGEWEKNWPAFGGQS